MTRVSNRGLCVALSRADGLDTAGRSDIMSVDTLANGPVSMRRWEQLCPFHVWPSPIIPVPGQRGVRARSTEAVWQGLKIVDGCLDLAQLHGIPHKRPPDHQRGPDFPYADSRFRYGELEIGLIPARYLIYLPTYLYVVEHLVDSEVIDIIENWLGDGRDVAFYDWDFNMNIDDPGHSFSHSALLAGWFNRQLGPVLDRAAEFASTIGSAAGTPPESPSERVDESPTATEASSDR